MEWQAVLSIINSGMHRMLKMIDDDKMVRITVMMM